MQHKRLFSPVIGLILLFPSAQGCLYFDSNYDPGLFQETQREALLFRDSSDPGVVNLILKSSVQGQLPPKLAWVVPLPSNPLDYREVDPEIFQELRKFFQDSYQTRGAGENEIPKVPQSISVHAKKTVGNYEIVPIEILSEESGGKELNKWLKEQGFIELPSEVQKPYLKKGATFLAIKLKPSGDNLELKPLLIRYRSPEMRFPLRFTHDYRTFDLDLYIVHPEASQPSGIPGASSGAMSQIRSMTSDVDSALEVCPTLEEYLGENNDLVLTRLNIRGVNTTFETKDLQRDPGL
jgi:hypothetical protein